MATDPNGPGNGIAVSGPGGFTAQFRGRGIEAALIIAFGLAVLYVNRVGFDALVASTQSQTKAVEQLIKHQTDEHTAMREAWEGMTYMLSQPQGERPRLIPPESVRRRMLAPTP